MLFICIPAYNEAETVGVLLWRIRTVFRDYAREYEVVVYDDASTDATAEVLEPYAKVLPLTVLRGDGRRGYAAAVDALARHVARRTTYPRRDAMVLMQADFTDAPEHLPELVKRFEGGADVVVAERGEPTAAEPAAVRRLRQLAPWVLRPFVRIEGVADPTSAYRLVRISVLRDALRERGAGPLVAAEGWAANVELLLALAPYARRLEGVTLPPRFDVRPRATRVRPTSDALALARYAWGARGRRVAAGRGLSLQAAAADAPAADAEAPRRAEGRGARPERAGAGGPPREEDGPRPGRASAGEPIARRPEVERPARRGAEAGGGRGVAAADEGATERPARAPRASGVRHEAAPPAERADGAAARERLSPRAHRAGGGAGSAETADASPDARGDGARRPDVRTNGDAAPPAGGIADESGAAAAALDAAEGALDGAPAGEPGDGPPARARKRRRRKRRRADAAEGGADAATDAALAAAEDGSPSSGEDDGDEPGDLDDPADAAGSAPLQSPAGEGSDGSGEGGEDDAGDAGTEEARARRSRARRRRRGRGRLGAAGASPDAEGEGSVGDEGGDASAAAAPARAAVATDPGAGEGAGDAVPRAAAEGAGGDERGAA